MFDVFERHVWRLAVLFDSAAFGMCPGMLKKSSYATLIRIYFVYGLVLATHCNRKSEYFSRLSRVLASFRTTYQPRALRHEIAYSVNAEECDELVSHV